jgi:UDP-3-O-[3-hydroxymyristoyl] glucosamine N-acyltransferase
MPSEDGTVQAWRFETQQRAWKGKVGRRGIVKAATSGDGTLLAAGSVIERNVTLGAEGEGAEIGTNIYLCLHTVPIRTLIERLLGRSTIGRFDFGEVIFDF